jgi:adenosine deaminase
MELDSHRWHNGKDMDMHLEHFIRAMPKIELHLHIEGAIPAETLLGFIQRKGTEPSIRSLEDLRKRLAYTDFAHFIRLWVWKNTFIRDEQDFEAIAYGVLADFNTQNVKYIEAFYAPGDYRRFGLSTEGITENLIQGMERAYKDFGIRCELIVDLIRDHGPEIGMERLDEVTPYLGKGVIGIGIGGSEQLFPADPYAPVYREASDRGFRLTAHAGEVAGADSIWAVIEKLHAERIGHGLRAFEDPELMGLLKERQIPLEMSVISNVRTRVCQTVNDHPIRDYFDRGLMVTLNSDDPTMFNSTLTDEYLTLARELDFTRDEVKRLAINSITSSFLPDSDKAAMRALFESEWRRWEDTHS